MKERRRNGFEKRRQKKHIRQQRSVWNDVYGNLFVNENKYCNRDENIKSKCSQFLIIDGSSCGFTDWFTEFFNQTSAILRKYSVKRFEARPFFPRTKVIAPPPPWIYKVIERRQKGKKTHANHFDKRIKTIWSKLFYLCIKMAGKNENQISIWMATCLNRPWTVLVLVNIRIAALKIESSVMKRIFILRDIFFTHSLSKLENSYGGVCKAFSPAALCLCDECVCVFF